MNFDELNQDNWLMFAIKNYDNPLSVTYEDFEEDLKRFKYIKRLLRRYETSGDFKVHLILNHIIILYNAFGDAATPLLFFKIDQELWSVLKTFLIFLGRIPEHPKTSIHDIPVDVTCLGILNKV